VLQYLPQASKVKDLSLTVPQKLEEKSLHEDIACLCKLKIRLNQEFLYGAHSKACHIKY
jgi:hypothetical protein